MREISKFSIRSKFNKQLMIATSALSLYDSSACGDFCFINNFMARNYHQGRYKPINPSKYKGDFKKITYRSGWEKEVFLWLDKNTSVLKWSSEEIVVPYKSVLDGRMHRYFTDVWMKVKHKDGSVSTYLIEIKPMNEVFQPKKRRKTKQYLYEVETYARNASKWKAAIKFCKKRNWKFAIITKNTKGNFTLIESDQLKLPLI